jgi:hypothetical protein
MQEWPISVTCEHLPIQNVKVINITSEEIMMLRLSAACVDSIKDALQFTNNLRAPSPSAPPETETQNRAAQGSTAGSVRGTGSKASPSNHGASGQHDPEPGQMFKILNSTGLGLACYTSWTDSAERVDLSSTAQTTDLKFQPQSGMVFLPDLARKVRTQLLPLSCVSWPG